MMMARLRATLTRLFITLALPVKPARQPVAAPDVDSPRARPVPPAA